MELRQRHSAEQCMAPWNGAAAQWLQVHISRAARACHEVTIESLAYKIILYGYGAMVDHLLVTIYSERCGERHQKSFTYFQQQPCPTIQSIWTLRFYLVDSSAGYWKVKK